jgi:hypothetical protein
VTGDLLALPSITDVLNHPNKKNINLQAQVGYLNLEHGIATVPLPGIDPFFYS